MAARIDNGHVQLLTRTGLDWTNKYPSVIAALANLNVKTAYLDGELCGLDDAGLPSFAQTQAATDGDRGARLVYYAFDFLHLNGWDISGLPLVELKKLLEPLLKVEPGLQFNGDETGDGGVILTHAAKLGFEGVASKIVDAPYAPGNRGLWRKAKAMTFRHLAAPHKFARRLGRSHRAIEYPVRAHSTQVSPSHTQHLPRSEYTHSDEGDRRHSISGSRSSQPRKRRVGSQGLFLVSKASRDEQ